MTFKATTMTAGAVAGLLVLAGLAVASGTAGEADASFGTNGLLIGGDGTIWATAVQGDGRIVAVGSEPSGTFVDGTETSAWFIRRYLADGDVDTDFGSSGVVNLFGESTRNERAIDVALDASGGIVVGGRGSLAVTSGKGKRQTTLQVPYAVVVRLEPDGGLDLDFGDDGYAFLSDISLLDAIAIQADGRIVISSEAQISNSGGGSKKKGGGGGNLTTALYLACLTSTGSLDSTFGSGGVVIKNLSSESFLTDEFTGHHELALQSNGDIILGAATRIGGGRQYWKLLRFDEDGLFDSTFGIVEESGLQLDGLTTDGSDRIVCVGLDQSTLDLVVIRYTASGARDTSFGSGGETTVAASNEVFANAGIRMAGSRVVVAGYQIDASDHYSMIALAFDADGDLDTSFGTGGFSDPITSTDGIGGTHLSVTPLGDILIGGTTPTYPDQQVLAQICGG